MKKRRVVVTGMGCVSPYGLGCSVLQKGIEENVNPFSNMNIKTSRTKTVNFPVGLVPNRRSLELDLPREITRTMPLLSIYAYLAAKEALEQAGINPTCPNYNSKLIGTSNIVSGLAMPLKKLFCTAVKQILPKLKVAMMISSVPWMTSVSVSNTPTEYSVFRSGYLTM